MSEVADFAKYVEDLGLIELTPKGNKYTYIDKKVQLESIQKQIGLR